ncbi:MAG TPA: DUF2800 domain-containing protein [Polyangiaceae bacterium]|nr:DUF2800 domain-containing protein [Polyangiaceae bacterium]
MSDLDPRAGRPSASQIEQMFLCPGSWSAQRGLPELPPDNANVRDSGIRIHAALAGDVRELETLSSDEMTTYEEMTRKTQELVEKHGYDQNNFIAESRMWFGSEFSGQPDRAYRALPRLLIIDYKAGFLPVTTASENPQLACLGVLGIHTYGAAEVTVAIIPRFGAIKECATYSLESAEAALVKIREIIEDAEKPEAPLRPGDKQCLYCRAKFRCGVRLNQLKTLAPVDSKLLPTLTGEQLVELLDIAPRIEKIITDIRAEAKRRLKSNEDVPGYYLKEGSPRDSITDLNTVFERLKTLGVTVEQFTSECGITKGEAKRVGKDPVKNPEECSGLRGLIWKANPEFYGKKLEAKLDEILEGCTETGEAPEPQLKRKEAV